MRTLIIIPTYNERENLPLLTHAVLAAAPTVDIPVVDDSSPDGTGAVADTLAAEDSRISVLHRAGKLGLGTAYVAGFHYGLEQGYQAVMEMDADFSHRPEDLPSLLDALETADVVIGSRYMHGGRTTDWSFLRSMLSRGGGQYAKWLLGLPIADCTGGFKAFRRNALEVLDLDRLAAKGFVFQVEVNYACHKAGLRMLEVPILFGLRLHRAV